MIGLAFSHLAGSENIGYIIPNEEIELFLKERRRRPLPWQAGVLRRTADLENPALRAFLKLEDRARDGGARSDTATRPTPLKQWDVITRIGGHADRRPGDDPGRDNLSSGSDTDPEDRAGRHGTLDHRARRQAPADPHAGPRHRPLLVDSCAGAYPPYFSLRAVGVRRAAPIESLQLLRTKSGSGPAALGSPLVARWGEPPDAGHEELVIVPSPLFPHALSKGYGNPSGATVKSVNGTPVRAWRSWWRCCATCKDEFVTIDFDNMTGEALVFPREQTGRRDRGDPHRQRRAGAGLGGNDEDLAGQVERASDRRLQLLVQAALQPRPLRGDDGEARRVARLQIRGEAMGAQDSFERSA